MTSPTRDLYNMAVGTTHHNLVMDELKNGRILSVGLACLDNVVLCKSYPEEDSDQRCLSSRWQRGGNASNNCTIFADFGVPCEYFGTLSLDFGGKFLKQNFEEHGICIENCVYYNNCESPTSLILINSQNGSRTILHSNRNLPEIKLEDFKKLNLRMYKWINFEGRPSVEEIKNILKYIDQWNNENKENRINISIELEKGKLQFIDLLQYGDLIFISKDFAKMYGCETMETAVEEISKKVKPGSVLVCPWGEKGACAKLPDGSVFTSPAFPPSQVVDTLGAGDTFVSATIIALIQGKHIADAIEYGCRIAGAKCGQHGMSGLSKSFSNISA